MKNLRLRRVEPCRVRVGDDGPWSSYPVIPGGRVFECEVRVVHNGGWIETLKVSIAVDQNEGEEQLYFARWLKTVTMTGGIGPAPEPVFEVLCAVDEGRVTENNFDIDIKSEKDFEFVPGTMLSEA